jgi:predicted transcriptional regulator
MAARTTFRSEPEMLKVVMESIISENGNDLRWTRIMSACRTNYRQIKRYRRIMADRGMIVLDGDAVEVTQKGFEFVALSRKFFGMLRNEGQVQEGSGQAAPSTATFP